MSLSRPDLTGIPAEVVSYIESLEQQLQERKEAPATSRAATALPDEPPTTKTIITISHKGMIKRTARHLYGRQRRGGMGVFDLDTTEDDAPTVLAHADADDTLLIFTDDGRVFRFAIATLPESPVRAKGQDLRETLALRPNERIVAALPDGGGKYALLLSRRGWVRRIPAAYLGKNLIPGTSFHDLKEGGPLVSACWSSGGGDVFIATREGKAIRFLETQVPARGCLGIRVDPADDAVAVTAMDETGGVLLIGEDGQGTIRLMGGFTANKAPAAGGKVAMKTDRLVGAMSVTPGDELFVISRLGKLIRFAADEIPPKEGVVQGVACMALRADEVTALTVTSSSPHNSF